jgi:hypothetical protein
MNAERRKARPETTYTAKSDFLDGSATRDRREPSEGKNLFPWKKGVIDQWGKDAGKGIKISKLP